MSANILVVEDERLVARHLKTSLNLMGYEVPAMVASGKEAVEQAVSLQPHLVLMDIWLKGDMDGIAAAEQIQAQLNIPVVFLTAYGDEATLRRAKITQPYGYILKPFEEKELRVTMEIALQRAVAENQMRQALTKEQELRELQRRFFSMVSHEFRTPLSTILMSAQILEQSDEAQTQKILKNLQRIQTSAKHTLRLLEDLLTINRIATDNHKFDAQPLDIEQFCLNLVEEISLRNSTQTKITLTSCCRGQVSLDQKLLYSILSNLLSNSIKYSSDGQIKLAINCQDQEINFSVQDQGIGISEDDLPQLFEPFHRGNNVGTCTGSGLGLTVVKHCVESHGGKITVESERGVGTTFTVTLPLN